MLMLHICNIYMLQDISRKSKDHLIHTLAIHMVSAA
jgi:hypothetical protein